MEGIGSYAFGKDDAVYRRTYPISELVSTTSVKPDGGTSVRLMNTQLLTNRLATCLDLAMTVDLEKKLVRSSIEIHEDKSQDQFRTHFDFILPYGFSSTNDKLIRDLQAVKDKTARVTECALNAEYEGRKACVLVIKYAEGFTYRYVLDLERGATPLEISELDTNDKPYFITWYSDIAKAQNMAWIPLKRIRYTPKTGGVNMITLTQVDITSIPTSNDFRLKFDEKYNVPDRMKSVIYRGIDEFSFRDDPRTALKKVPLVRRRDSATPPPALPQERPRPFPTLQWVGGVCLLVGLVILVWMKVRRTRA